MHALSANTLSLSYCLCSILSTSNLHNAFEIIVVEVPKLSPVVLPQTNINSKFNEESVSLQEEEDKENTDALQQLIKGKNPPAQMVQSLLTATRASRERWLQKPSISIQDILQKYLALQNSKWVCNTLSINTHTCTE